MSAASRIARARPTLQDVERLSRGMAATRRGIGSRRVPHRLNEEERVAFSLAQKRGFAVMQGSGYRRERKGSPLLNSLRQHADALGKPLVWVERGHPLDHTCVDISPCRCTAETEIAAVSEAISVVAEQEPLALSIAIPTATTGGDLDQLCRCAIWELPRVVWRFSCDREADEKLSKRLAAALALSLSCSTTVTIPSHRRR